MPIRFFDVHDEPYGAFSNQSKHPFTLDHVWYATAEHAFQAAKFVGTPQAEAIRRQRGAKDAARMARDLRACVRSDWEAVRVVELRRILLAKFTAHEAVRDLLMGTGDAPIEFASPMDRFWGTGRDGSGQNQMGGLLTELRGILRTLKATHDLPESPPSGPKTEGGQEQITHVGDSEV